MSASSYPPAQAYNEKPASTFPGVRHRRAARASLRSRKTIVKFPPKQLRIIPVHPAAQLMLPQHPPVMFEHHGVRPVYRGPPEAMHHAPIHVPPRPPVPYPHPLPVHYPHPPPAPYPHPPPVPYLHPPPVPYPHLPQVPGWSWANATPPRAYYHPPTPAFWQPHPSMCYYYDAPEPLAASPPSPSSVEAQAASSNSSDTSPASSESRTLSPEPSVSTSVTSNSSHMHGPGLTDEEFIQVLRRLVFTTKLSKLSVGRFLLQGEVMPVSVWRPTGTVLLVRHYLPDGREDSMSIAHVCEGNVIKWTPPPRELRVPK